MEGKNTLKAFNAYMEKSNLPYCLVQYMSREESEAESREFEKEIGYDGSGPDDDMVKKIEAMPHPAFGIEEGSDAVYEIFVEDEDLAVQIAWAWVDGVNWIMLQVRFSVDSKTQ